MNAIASPPGRARSASRPGASGGAAIQSLEPRRLLAAQPVLVRDINPGTTWEER